MIPVVILLRNNLYLNRKCLKSVLAQDIPVMPWLIDNASTDGTPQWAQTLHDVLYTYNVEPMSVAKCWNTALSLLFNKMGFEAAIMLNNDTELRPDTARHLLNDGGGFVTAIGATDPSRIKPPYINPDPAKKRPHPDFSCYLIRREVYEAVGPFDENFLIGFVEDQDYHVRMHKAGIHAMALEMSFLHHGSMTIKNAELGEIRRIQMQAEKNREYFRRKWGFAGASEEYYRFFGSSAPTETSGT